MDFHTHNLLAKNAIINMPREWLLHPECAALRNDALYSAGVHPWWTDSDEEMEAMLRNLPTVLQRGQVVAVGECGMDLLRGAERERQLDILRRQLLMAEEMGLPVTLHVVRAFDVMLRLRKEMCPTTKWTIHGFRGKPALAEQLLRAGFDLSFGRRRNEESFRITPVDRRHEETDEDY